MCFAHRLLLYTAADEFLATTVPFLQCGFAGDDALLAVTDEAGIGLLRDALGGGPAVASVADSADRYCYPARTLAGRADQGDASDRAVRVISRPARNGHRDVGILGSARHESATPTGDAVFAGCTVPCICPDAEEGGGDDMQAGAGSVDRFGHHDLAKVRRHVADRAHRAGLESQQIAELVFLVHEIAYNAVEHGGGKGVLQMASADGHLVCEVTSATVTSGGPFSSHLRAADYLLRGVEVWSSPALRLARRWSDPVVTRPHAARRDGGAYRGAEWDWPG